MSSNIFNGKRFLLLCKQHFIHHNQLLLLSTVAYIGAIFIVLSIAQIGNDLQPHDLNSFQGFLMGFVAVFGILYVGHSFPAFRSKESTINYLMAPGSLIEKFVLEFVIRIGVMVLALPLLYWITFHFQGYFFIMFASEVFEPIGLQYLTKVEVAEGDYPVWMPLMAGSAVLLAFVVAFTGAAMFSKQPLVKSLFSVAVLVIFYTGYSYIVIEPLGLAKYNPPESMWLIPMSELAMLQFFSAVFILATIVMLFVAYRKLKEREV